MFLLIFYNSNQWFWEVTQKNELRVSFKHVRGAAVGIKFAPLYALIYMTARKDDFLETLIKKPWLW